MASRDGLAEPEAVGNSNTLLWVGQIAVLYGSQLFVKLGPSIANISGSNHRIPKPRRQNLGLVSSFVHARPQLPENFLSKVWVAPRSVHWGRYTWVGALGHRDLVIASVLGLLVGIFRNT